jgi:hypothetical protein
MTFDRILSLQIVVFLVLLLVLCLPRVRVALVPRRARRAVAYRPSRLERSHLPSYVAPSKMEPKHRLRITGGLGG